MVKYGILVSNGLPEADPSNLMLTIASTCVVVVRVCLPH
jgi:hypothetical protein